MHGSNHLILNKILLDNTVNTYTNAFTNYKFEDTTGWSLYGNITLDTSVKYSGYNSLHFNVSGQGIDQGFGARYTLSVTPTKEYTFTYYVKSNDLSTIDSTGVTTFISHKNSGGTTTLNENIAMSLTEQGVWKKVSTTFTSNSDDATIIVGFGCVRNGNVSFAYPEILLASDVSFTKTDNVGGYYLYTDSNDGLLEMFADTNGVILNHYGSDYLPLKTSMLRCSESFSKSDFLTKIQDLFL